jgi:uncharacterized protein (DUF433 family)
LPSSNIQCKKTANITGRNSGARIDFAGSDRRTIEKQITETEPRKTTIMPEQPIDWSQCEDVESVPGRLSGAWVIKGTRVPAQAVVDNARDGFTAEEIATEIFELPIERVRGVLRFAKIAPPSNG